MRFWGKKREEPFRGEVTLYRGVFRTEEQRDGFAAYYVLPGGIAGLLREAGERVNARLLVGQAVAVGGADRGEVTEDFAAYAVELAAIQDGRLPAPEGMAALEDALARQKPAQLAVTATPCAALTLDRAEALHGGALEIAWGEIAEG